MDGEMKNARYEWGKVHALLQRMFRKAEWYRVQDHEVSSWAKTMQTDMLDAKPRVTAGWTR